MILRSATISDPLRAFVSDLFPLPLPDKHRFPADKYRALREKLWDLPLGNNIEFHLAPAANDRELLTVHTLEYLEKIKSGRLSDLEIRRIGFPWSAELVERSRRSTGATLAAGRFALVDGIAHSLAGGTHHAFADHGQGYCVFNDIAVAIRVLQSERLISRALVIDCDVHQGNGTAHIFQDDESVFTFSMHGDNNFPFQKTNSDLDIGLPDGTNDDGYLVALESALRDRLPIAEVDLVFYIAGADPFEKDRLGKLKLTKEGLTTRDQLVLNRCLESNVPVTIVLGGGYSESISDIVEIHLGTINEASDFRVRWSKK